ncbi:MAG: hypothetical protein OEQ29_08380 [Alphaproteobacteria bacterium]|nr:hypothetical protein [Alphaproteobacteria bacterium]
MATVACGHAFAEVAGGALPVEGGPDRGSTTRALPRCQGAPQCLPSFIARLKHAPFPLEANDDGGGRPFFNETDRDSGLRVRVNRHGDRYPEPKHYADPSVLFHIAAGFDRARPFRLVVFFHGHQSTLERDVVGRIGLTRQIDASGANVILIAPQLAKDAIDSHPGKLIRAGALARLLDESAGVLARALGADLAPRLARAPLVLVAYSGGYLALAAGLAEAETGDAAIIERVEGIVMLDAVFGNLARIDGWLQARAGRVFLVGLFGKLSRSWTLDLIYRWEARGQPYGQLLPARLDRGSIVVMQVDTDHEAIATDGPPRNPIAEIVRRLPPPAAALTQP